MKKQSVIQKVLFFLYAIINTVFLIQVFNLKSLPSKLFIPLVIIDVLLLILIAYGVFKSKAKLTNVLSKFLLFLLTVALTVANVYVAKYGSVLGNVTGGNTMTDTVSVVVKKESVHEDLPSIINLNIGVEASNSVIVDQAREYFNEQVNDELMYEEITGYVNLAKALMDDEVEVIIVNEAYRSFIEDEYPDFTSETKVIAQYHYKQDIEKPDKKELNVTKDTFSVLISGIDVYGNITNNSRSDVNILAVINPVKKQVALVSIPRDYYVPMACQNDALDKLTHTGIYGVDCTMDTLGNVFGLDIDYYARVNFSSLINVIDALGGVNVYVDAPFSANGYNFTVGDNYLDGEKALVFVRDRYHQAAGDSGRGQNQMKVVAAIINKIASPTLITNFSQILSSIDGSFQTNMTSNDINSLVKMQINDLASWNIQQLQVSGYGTTDYSFALGHNAYMMVPDYDSVAEVVKHLETLY